MNRTLRLSRLALLALLAAAGCGGNDADDTPTFDNPKGDSVPAVTETGSIAGRVTLAGAAPTLEPFEIVVNADVCGAAAKSNLLSLGADSGIAGAVVYVEGPAAAAAVEPQMMDQSGCQYTPRVLATTPGSVIRFRNSDPTPHNVRVENIATGKIVLNIAQGAQGKVDEWKIDEPGAYIVACDYHPWMNAYVVAPASGLAAVTGADGSFTIDRVPVGSHTVKVWHNAISFRQKRDQAGRLIGYGFKEPVQKSATVQVAKDQKASLDITLELGAGNPTAS
jgi:plastocyanin